MFFQGTWAFVQQYLLPSGFVWLTPHGVNLTCSSIPRFLIKWKLDINNQLNSGYIFLERTFRYYCVVHITSHQVAYMSCCLTMKDDKIDHCVKVLTIWFLQCKFFPLVNITPVVWDSWTMWIAGSQQTFHSNALASIDKLAWINCFQL